MPYDLILNDFLELVAIDTQPLDERAIADVVRKKLLALGLEVVEDEAGKNIDGRAGNLIARLPGSPEVPAILFSAHLDRVPNPGNIRPLISTTEDKITSQSDTILAADDVSGLCAILDGLRRLISSGRSHGEVEVVFSVAEEIGLLGAKHLDYSQLKSKMAYVVDTGGRLGTLINQAPTHYNFIIKVHGRSAHAGIEPEKGLSAIRVAAQALSRIREGRLSPKTTSNFGIFKAGKADNIVCDYAEITGEARSTDERELSAYLAEVKEVFQTVASEYETTIEVKTALDYSGFKVDKAEPIIKAAGTAMKQLGVQLNIQPSGGGMDGNIFNQKGIKTVGLSPGYFNVHTAQEGQIISDLVKCGQLIEEIIIEIWSSAARTNVALNVA